MLSGRDMPSLRFVTGGPADFRSWQNAARNLEVFGSKRFVKLIQDRLKQRSRIAYATLSVKANLLLSMSASDEAHTCLLQALDTIRNMGPRSYDI